MFFSKLVALAFAVLALAACGSVPRPFARGSQTLLLDMPQSLGVYVAPIVGLPEPVGNALRAGVSDGLQRESIPATGEGGNRGSFRLFGEGDVVAGTVRVTWRLVDWTGQEVAMVAQSTPEAGHTGEQAYTALGRDAGLRLARDVRRSGLGGEVGIVRQVGPEVCPIEVEGIDEESGKALAGAVTAALRSRGVRVLGEAAPGCLRVNGTVRVTPERAGGDKVELAWRLGRADGQEVGTVNQANVLPPRALDRGWAPVAGAAADGAATGLGALLEQLDKSRP